MILNTLSDVLAPQQAILLMAFLALGQATQQLCENHAQGPHIHRRSVFPNHVLAIVCPHSIELRGAVQGSSRPCLEHVPFFREAEVCQLDGEVVGIAERDEYVVRADVSVRYVLFRSVKISHSWCTLPGRFDALDAREILPFLKVFGQGPARDEFEVEKRKWVDAIV